MEDAEKVNRKGTIKKNDGNLPDYAVAAKNGENIIEILQNQKRVTRASQILQNSMRLSAKALENSEVENTKGAVSQFLSNIKNMVPEQTDKYRGSQ